MTSWVAIALADISLTPVVLCGKTTSDCCDASDEYDGKIVCPTACEGGSGNSNQLVQPPDKADKGNLVLHLA